MHALGAFSWTPGLRVVVCCGHFIVGIKPLDEFMLEELTNYGPLSVMMPSGML